jgi:hypothetical protein
VSVAATAVAPVGPRNLFAARPRALATLALLTAAWLPFYQGIDRVLSIRGNGLMFVVVELAKDAMLAVLTGATLLLFVSGALRIRRPLLPAAVAGAALALYVLALSAHELFAVNTLYAIRVFGEPVIGGISLGVLLHRAGRRDALPAVLAVVSIVVVLIGVIQVMFPLAPLTVALRTSMVDEQGQLPETFYSSVGDVIRAFSTLDVPNDLGFFGVLVALSSYAPSPWLHRRPKLVGLVRVLAVVACLISFSRSAVLAGITGGATLALTYVLWDPRAKTARVLRRTVIGLVVLGGGGALMWVYRDTLLPVQHAINAVTGADLSARVHAESLLEGLRRSLMNPQGIGLGRVGSRAGLYGNAGRAFSVESTYLLLALEIGWLGLSVVVLALLAAIGGALRLASDRASAAADQQWARVAAAIIVAQVTVYVFLPTIEVLQTGVLVWAHLGLVLCQPSRAAV